MVLKNVCRMCTARSIIAVCLALAISIVYFTWLWIEEVPSGLNRDRGAALRDIETTLEELVKQDKGTGCQLPQLDPFAPEATLFDKIHGPIQCKGQDWIKCYHSTCRLVDSIKASVTDVTCVYKDILYQDDNHYRFGRGVRVRGGEYKLKASDHVKVTCFGKRSGKSVRWSGITLGLRPVTPAPSPPGREDSFNVLMFGFDSTSRTGFIRMMPKSWAALNELGATVMEGYNIVGDGTINALLPILTGRTLLEVPEVRNGYRGNCTVDDFPFIFHLLKKDGYHTAYLEDSPYMNTFNLHLVGFRRQPTDRYLRSFIMEQRARNTRTWIPADSNFCIGDTPQFKRMMNVTQQFMELRGKKFIFTFVVDISHDDINYIQCGDNDTAAFLRTLGQHAEDTLIIIMGDHGPRYSKRRKTLRGKLDERLPLMALRLPARLTRARPAAQRALEHNARALTTPHDLHATILDVLGWRDHWNPYKIPGADLLRGLTMIEEIPLNRSCSEASVEPHWCACLVWEDVSTTDPVYNDAGRALLLYINELIQGVSSRCAPRTLVSVERVLRQRVNNEVVFFRSSCTDVHCLPQFEKPTDLTKERYQVMIVSGPGRAEYEATMTYILEEKKFIVNSRDISRINAYAKEPDCIADSHPHLVFYCYCR